MRALLLLSKSPEVPLEYAGAIHAGWPLPCTFLDWQWDQARQVAEIGCHYLHELGAHWGGWREPLLALPGSHYINRIWLPSSIGASAVRMVPRVPILFCPRQWSWVMDRGEPANAWCNCQRDLIISTLHMGLLCSAVSSLLSGNLEWAWTTGGGVLQKVTSNTFAPLLPKSLE